MEVASRGAAPATEKEERERGSRVQGSEEEERDKGTFVNTHNLFII